MSTAQTEKRTLFTDDERGMIALRSTYELGALLDVLNREADIESDELDVITKSLTKRMTILNNMVMSAISDQRETTESLQERFNH